MKPNSLPRFAAAIFALCLIAYAVLFSTDQWLRTRKGPWMVAFSNEPNGTPRLDIRQPALGIENVRILFVGEQTHTPASEVRFDQPNRSIPFGKNVFSDTTYLPGTLTLLCFGHEIELLPRTLIVNRREIQWERGLVVRLTPSDRPRAFPAPHR